MPQTKEQIAAYNKQYRLDNREHLAARRKQYYQDNREGINARKRQHYQDTKESINAKARQRYQDSRGSVAARGKQYRQDNRDSINAKKKQYRQDNKESINARGKQYRQDNRESIKKRGNKECINAGAARRRATQLNATPVWADHAKIQTFYARAKRMGGIFTGWKFHVDHVIPLKHELVCGLHCEANLSVEEQGFNGRKYNKFTTGEK